MKSKFLAKQFGYLACVLGLSLAASCAAQTPTSPAAPQSASLDQSPQPALTVREEKALADFEPPVGEEYTLGAGDQITLDFASQPDLNTKTTIGPDGIITVKQAGHVRVADLTREDAGKAITKALSPYYKDADVTISIDKYSSNEVRVTGYVQHPGEIVFEGTPTLLDAIGRAGLIAPQVTANGVSTNIDSGIPETCTIYRANNVAVQVQLRELLMKGSTYADLRLRRNDIVYVPQPTEQFVSVLGNVAKPGTVPLTPKSTLTSILATAGCCTEMGGFTPKIHILQPSTGKDFVVSYKQIMTLPGQQEFTLHSGDVIVVPTSGFSKVTSVIQKISPIATIISFAAILGAG